MCDYCSITAVPYYTGFVSFMEFAVEIIRDNLECSQIGSQRSDWSSHGAAPPLKTDCSLSSPPP